MIMWLNLAHFSLSEFVKTFDINFNEHFLHFGAA